MHRVDCVILVPDLAGVGEQETVWRQLIVRQTPGDRAVMGLAPAHAGVRHHRPAAGAARNRDHAPRQGVRAGERRYGTGNGER